MTRTKTRALANWPNNAVSVLDFGAVGDGVTDCFPALNDAWQYALANECNLYFPAGTFVCQDFSFPFGRINGLPPSTLLDCKGIKVSGEGRNTILKTISSGGADVLQINGAKNLTIEGFQLEAELTGSNGSGSNAVSVTFGGDNLNFNDLYAVNLPYVEKPAYVDGGSGYTIQTGVYETYLGIISFNRCVAVGCARGFHFDVYIEKMTGDGSDISFTECKAIDCWYGTLLSNAAPTSLVDNVSGAFGCSTVDVTHVNCTRAVFMSRLRGGSYRCTVLSTKSKADLLLNPQGVAWVTDPTLAAGVAVFEGLMLHNLDVEVTGIVKDVDTKVSLGATTFDSTTIPGIGGGCDSIKAKFQILGNASVDFDLIENGGNTIKNSYIDTFALIVSEPDKVTIALQDNVHTVSSHSYIPWYPQVTDTTLGTNVATASLAEGMYDYDNGKVTFTCCLVLDDISALNGTSVFLIGLPMNDISAGNAPPITRNAVTLHDNIAVNDTSGFLQSYTNYIALFKKVGTTSTSIVSSDLASGNIITVNGHYYI